jgi:hypothetical protein
VLLHHPDRIYPPSFRFVYLSEGICEGLGMTFALFDIAFSQEPEMHAVPLQTIGVSIGWQTSIVEILVFG